MTFRRTIRTLARYNAWADRLVVLAVADLPEGEATKPRETLFRNMVHTLNHNYVIDRIFQAHLEGREHGYAARNTTCTTSEATCARRRRRSTTGASPGATASRRPNWTSGSNSPSWAVARAQ